MDEIFAPAPQPILFTDDDRRYVIANQASVNLLGLALSEVLKMRVDDVAAPELRDQIPMMWTHFLEGGYLEGNFALVTTGGIQPVTFVAHAHYRPGLHLSILRPLEGSEGPPADSLLTPRQREVLRFLALGYTGPEIASELVISAATVRTHIENGMRALRARTRPEAVALALRHREIEL